MARETLSLVMIVKNEESVLSRCLESVRDVVDEMIVVDTGSIDQTKEIASSFGATVIDHPWEDDFSAPRNAGIEHATSDWILQLDADEELVSGFDALGRYLSNSSIDGYMVELAIASDKEHADASAERFSAVRLFRNKPGIKYVNRIHEIVSVDEDRLAVSPLVICHFGPFLGVDGSGVARLERNIALLRKALELDPDDPTNLCYLGTNLFWIGKAEDAVQAFSKARDKDESGNAWIVSRLRYLVLALYATGNKEGAGKVLSGLRSDHPEFTDLAFMEAELAYLSGERRMAVDLIRECLRMGDSPPYFASWGGTGSWRAKELLEVITGNKKRKKFTGTVFNRVWIHKGNDKAKETQ